MKFSIIIPVHNAEDRICKALDIIKSQTFTDYELICVCDSCTDRSASICKGYTNNVYEVDFHNDGLTRSKGIDVATGDWILFHDDDDWWNSNHVLEDISKMIDKIGYAHMDVLCCGFNWLGVGVQTYLHPNTQGLWLNVWSRVWKREAIGDTRFPNVHSVSDAEFCKLMFDKDLKVVLWNYVFYEYNWMRPGSITETDRRQDDK